MKEFTIAKFKAIRGNDNVKAHALAIKKQKGLILNCDGLTIINDVECNNPS